MSNKEKLFIGILVVAGILLGAYALIRVDEGMDAPAIPEETVDNLVPAEGMPFKFARVFSFSVFANARPGARAFARDGFGNFWVSSPSKDTVFAIELNR